MANVRVGLFPTVAPLTGGEELRTVLARAAEVGVDHLCVGDHVSFFVGAGSDGLTTATSLLVAQADLPVYVALYLLPLRHPVPVARHATLAARTRPAHTGCRDRRRGPPRDRDLRRGPEDADAGWTRACRSCAVSAKAPRSHSTANSSRSTRRSSSPAPAGTSDRRRTPRTRRSGARRSSATVARDLGLPAPLQRCM